MFATSEIFNDIEYLYNDSYIHLSSWAGKNMIFEINIFIY